MRAVSLYYAVALFGCVFIFASVDSRVANPLIPVDSVPVGHLRDVYNRLLDLGIDPTSKMIDGMERNVENLIEVLKKVLEIDNILHESTVSLRCKRAAECFINRAVQFVPPNLQATIAQQREESGMMSADLAGRQRQIAQLQQENTILRNQLGIHAGMSAAEARCHIFRHRLIGLLIRAKDGYDYRCPSNREPYMSRFTVSRSAKGKFSTQHGLKKSDWETVEKLMIDCLVQLPSIGPITDENRAEWNDIKKKIEEMFGLLNFKRLSKDITEKNKELKARKIKVCRTLQRLFETISAYIGGQDLPPDPLEIIIDDTEALQEVEINKMLSWLKEAASS